MFKFASSFERTLSDWNSSPIVDKTNMFLNSTCTVEKCLERTVLLTLNPIISSIPSKYVCKDSEGSKVIEYKNKNYSCKKISRSGSIKQMCKRRKARIACPITCDSCQSKLPSSIPSVLPTISLLPNSQSIPSRVPSMNPSPYPSKSRSPTEGSSKAPSDIFSPLPSVVPSSSPAESPSVSPSISQSPSFEASVLPTVAVTDSKSVANLFIKQEYVKKLSCRKIRKWIKNKDNKGCRYCGDENVKNLCPVTCKRCEQYIWSSAFPTASSVPSFSHSVPPSNQVTISPSPSSVPSSLPSLTYSDIPSMVISNTPSSVPIASPSEVPTSFPSVMPSIIPSYAPTTKPSLSLVPTDIPSVAPSDVPSALPSRIVRSRDFQVQFTFRSNSCSQNLTTFGTQLVGNTFGSLVNDTSDEFTAGDIVLDPTELPSDECNNGSRRRLQRRRSIVIYFKVPVNCGNPPCENDLLPKQRATRPVTPAPTVIPSMKASSVPSFSHSVPPSNQATISPSPSSVPSSLPSLTYSDIPSMVISNTSSSVPIASPSEVPTSFPSEHNQTEQLSVRLLALEGGTESLKQNKGTEFLTNSKRSTSRHSQKEKHPRALQKLRSSKGDVPRFKSSSYPSFIPSSQPDMAPSSIPSISPSLVPSAIPTNNPTSTPSAIPSLSMAPSSVPSSSPTYVVVIELNQKVSKVTEKKFLTNLSNETDVEMDVETEAFFGDVEEVKIQVVKVDLFY